MEKKISVLVSAVCFVVFIGGCATAQDKPSTPKTGPIKVWADPDFWDEEFEQYLEEYRAAGVDIEVEEMEWDEMMERVEALPPRQRPEVILMDFYPEDEDVFFYMVPKPLPKV